MIRRRGIYYLDLIKEFDTNMTQKTNKSAISVMTTIKGVRIHFDIALISEITHIPNAGPIITFSSTSRIIFGDDEWNLNSTCNGIGIYHRSNFGTMCTIWNSMDLIPHSKIVIYFIRSYIANRSRKSFIILSIPLLFSISHHL